MKSNQKLKVIYNGAEWLTSPADLQISVEELEFAVSEIKHIQSHLETLSQPDYPYKSIKTDKAEITIID